MVFNDGEQFKTISIFIQPDATPEVDEVFNVSLTGVSGGATIGTPGTGELPCLVSAILLFIAFILTIHKKQ